MDNLKDILEEFDNRIVALEKKLDKIQKTFVLNNLTEVEKEDCINEYKSCIDSLQYEKAECIDKIMQTMKKIIDKLEKCDNVDFDIITDLLDMGNKWVKCISDTWYTMGIPHSNSVTEVKL